MISRYSLKFDLDFTFHRSSNGEVVLLESFKKNLFLNKIFVLIRGNPGWSSTKRRWVIVVNNSTIISRWSHDEKTWTWLLSWLGSMRYLVEMVMNHFAQIDERIVLDLD